MQEATAKLKDRQASYGLKAIISGTLKTIAIIMGKK